jgi:hypothetical protein
MKADCARRKCPTRFPWVEVSWRVRPQRLEPGSFLDSLRRGWKFVRTGLPPRWGFSAAHFSPRLAPWAAFLRRFAARSEEHAPPKFQFSRMHSKPRPLKKSKEDFSATCLTAVFGMVSSGLCCDDGGESFSELIANLFPECADFGIGEFSGAKSAAARERAVLLKQHVSESLPYAKC